MQKGNSLIPTTPAEMGKQNRRTTAQTSQKNKTKTYLSLDSGSTKCPQLGEGTDRASLTWMDTAAAPKKKKKDLHYFNLVKITEAGRRSV